MPMTIPHCLRNRVPRSKPNNSAFAFADAGGKIHYEFHCHCSLAKQKAQRLPPTAMPGANLNILCSAGNIVGRSVL
jgi:hypothetical protein